MFGLPVCFLSFLILVFVRSASLFFSAGAPSRRADVNRPHVRPGPERRPSTGNRRVGSGRQEKHLRQRGELLRLKRGVGVGSCCSAVAIAAAFAADGAGAGAAGAVAIVVVLAVAGAGADAVVVVVDDGGGAGAAGAAGADGFGNTPPPPV